MFIAFYFWNDHTIPFKLSMFVSMNTELNTHIDRDTDIDIDMYMDMDIECPGLCLSPCHRAHNYNNGLNH